MQQQKIQGPMLPISNERECYILLLDNAMAHLKKAQSCLSNLVYWQSMTNSLLPNFGSTNKVFESGIITKLPAIKLI